MLALATVFGSAAEATDPFAEIERLEREQQKILSRIEARSEATTSTETAVSTTADAALSGPSLTGQIVFARFGQLYLLDPSGTGPRQIQDLGARAYDPDLSFDRRRIVFGDRSLHIHDLTTQVTSHLIDGPTFAKFHPSGANTLVYGVPTRGLYVHSIDQDTVLQLLDNTLQPMQPAWHPDGDRVVFVGQPATGQGNRYLYSISTDCLGRRDCAGEVEQLVHDGRFNHMPAWSPDGTRIAFSRVEGMEDSWAVMVLDLASGTLRRVTPPDQVDLNPIWLPDSQHLIVLRDDPNVSGLKNLHLIDRTGRSLRQLTTDGASAASYRP